jgi:hypothetical protein
MHAGSATLLRSSAADAAVDEAVPATSHLAFSCAPHKDAFLAALHGDDPTVASVAAPGQPLPLSAADDRKPQLRA